MDRRVTPGGEKRVFRIVVGGAYLALTLMLLWGVTRYFALIAPRYGKRFAYLPILMAAVGCWLAVRGTLVLLGRTGAGR